MSDRQILLERAIYIAKDAGKLVLTYFGNVKQVTFKGTIDLVTEADKASEKLIVKKITDYYPDHGILGEEETNRAGTGEYRWIVDPIDGTTNFAHAHPFFAVSIGIEYENEIIIGVVYAPYFNELYYAVKDGGAYYIANTGKEPVKLNVSSNKQLKDCVLATGFAYTRNETEYNNIANFKTLLMQCRGIRRSGSAALDLAYVAHGRLDGYWEYNLKAYDVAAGSLLVKEAGGFVSDWLGKEDYVYSGNIAAANPYIHNTLRDNLIPLPDEIL